MQGSSSTTGEMKRLADSIRKEISKAIVGYEDNIGDLMTCLIADGHMLVEGVPGIAKTTLSKAFAQSLQIIFNRIQFTQDLLPSDITGYNFFNQENRKFELRKGPIFTELLLADEINRAPPKTQSALLEAMQERQVTIENETIRLPPVFLVMATLNPIETEGVYPLPEAQIDRFMMKITMGYPSLDEELRILEMKNRDQPPVDKVIDRETILRIRAAAAKVHVHPSIMRYIRDIARRTREVDDLELGLSPRGAIHLLQASKAHAYLDGRGYVIPDDVKELVHKVLNHRLILSPEAELEGVTVSGVTEDLLADIPLPKEDFGASETEE